MNCRDAIEEIIGRSEPTGAALEHLDGCEQCRLFLADLKTIQQAFDTPVTTPPALATNTLARSLEMLREKTAAPEASPLQRWRRALDSPRVVAAAAALGVVVLAIWIALQIDGAKNDAANVPLKLAIIQIVAQNVFTALFLPAFLLFKGGLARSPFRTMKSGV